MTLNEWQQAGRSFRHRSHTVFYRQEGDPARAPALLLIHGFPTASWDWQALWPALAQRFAGLLAPDMIGFGFSAKPRDYEYSILDQADLHENLLKQFGAKRFHVLAHDYGDTVAQELLARHEERRKAGDASLVIESCVFLNGGLFPETHRPRLIQKLLASSLGAVVALLSSQASFNRSFSAIFGAGTRPTAAELDDFWRLVSHENGQRIFHKLIGYMQERRTHRERWVGVLRETKVPLRVINGPDDPVSGAHMVARYRELVPNPDCVSLPGIGHYPQVEDPAGVLRALEEFYTRLVGGALAPTGRG